MSFIALDVRGGRFARGLRHHRNCFAYLGDAARLMPQITTRVKSRGVAADDANNLPYSDIAAVEREFHHAVALA